MNDRENSHIEKARPLIRFFCFLCPVLKRRYEQRTSEYVFENTSGGARGYSAKGIYEAFGRAGLSDFRIHDLRHACASRLVQNGLSLYEVSQVLGHTDVQTTQRYAHLEARTISEKARDIIEKLGCL
jgi:integrase